MATVPYGGGLPDAAPLATPPDDYQRVQATPNSFGAQIGQGLQQAGQGTSALGQFWGQVQTDGVLNDTQSAQDQLVTEFKKLRGGDALDQQTSFQSRLDDIQTQAREKLKTPIQQLQFDQTMRPFRERYINGQINNHADQQGYLHAKDVNTSTFNNSISMIPNVADDEEGVKHLIGDATNAQIKQAALDGNGNDPEALARAKGVAEATGYKTWIDTIAVRDPLRAAQLADQHKAELGTAYIPLASALRARVNTADGQGIAHQAIADTGAALVQPGGQGMLDVRHAILGQESGDSDNAPATVAKIGPDGKPILATGPGQILPDTFVRFAKPGERIDVPADNRAASGRYIDHLAQVANNDPARIAVGYFSGEGNIAPADSPTPWIADKADRTGKTVSSYVADIQGRIGALPSGASVKGSAYQRVLDMTRDKPPEVRQAALREVNEQYTAAQVATEADAKARRDASDRAANGYVTEMMQLQSKGQAPNADMIGRIANDPTLDHQTKASLWNMVETHAKRDAGRDIATYGAGFYDLYSKIHLPDDDPNRIADPKQLYGHVGDSGDLTVAGVDRLTQEIMGKRTADGEAESAMKKQFLANAKKQISGADPLLHIADPKGEELYLKFMASFFPAYDQAKAAGKTPAAMLNPDSPDYLGKGIAGFKRPLAELTADLLRGDATAEAGTVGAGASAAAPDTTTQEGLVAAVRAGRLSRADGEKLALERGWIQGAAPAKAGADLAPPIR